MLLLAFTLEEALLTQLLPGEQIRAVRMIMTSCEDGSPLSEWLRGPLDRLFKHGVGCLAVIFRHLVTYWAVDL